MRQDERKALVKLVDKWALKAVADLGHPILTSCATELLTVLDTFTEDEVRIEGFRPVVSKSGLMMLGDEEADQLRQYRGKTGTLTFTPDKEKP